MPRAVLVVGVLAQVVVWRLVVRGRLPFWPATAATFALIGVASILIGQIEFCREIAVTAALGVGVATGVALFGATRLVVGLATRHRDLRRAVGESYRPLEETPFMVGLVLTLFVAVPGEELFWRGLALTELTDATSTAMGAVLTWAVAVGVNAAWTSLPLLAGAVVGGAVWTGLAVWSGGVVAPIASHFIWTGLMLLWPPSAARDKVPS